jgi:anti-sigma B factor antagonist
MQVNETQLEGRVMSIDEKVKGDAVVLMPDSDITWRNQPELKHSLDDLSAEGRHHIIIDLTNVHEISGYGLGLLASRCGRLRRQHGDIRLANASGDVKRLLQVTNLNKLFDLFDTADSAVRSFTIMDSGEDPEPGEEE